AEDGIRGRNVTGVQTCALPISPAINVPGGLQDGPRNSQLDEVSRRHVLLKLSGEVFGGGSIGVDPDTVRSVAEQIAAAAGRVEKIGRASCRERKQESRGDGHV